MDLDSVRQLAPEDQQVFLLGRIVSETTKMDAAQRFLLATLRGQEDLDAYLDTPANFSTGVNECTALVQEAELDEKTREAVLGAVEAGALAYKRRNRFIHDMLREDLGNRASWELARLTRQPPGRPDFVLVDADAMIDLVRKIIAATWRLRACAVYLHGGGWEGLVFGEVEGDWDGSSNYSR